MFSNCMAAVQVLRAVATLSTTIMYIPLVSTIIEVFNCKETWDITGWPCYTGIHLAVSVTAAIVAFGFSIFSFVGTSYRVSCMLRLCRSASVAVVEGV